MTILGTTAILAAMSDGRIVCDPTPARVEGAHIDVTLGRHYWMLDWPNDRRLVLRDADPADYFIDIEASEAGALVIPPCGFILAHTAEAIGTSIDSGLVPMLHTRSTLARWGLSVCTANAGMGDPGYAAPWTLEIINPHPVAVAVPVGARVGAIAFHRIEGTATPYAPDTRYNQTRDTWTPTAMLPRRSNW